MYIDFDEEKKVPVNEVIDKNDVYYGNENDDDIQNQPYILIRKRMPVSNARTFAVNRGVSKEEAKAIVGDNDTFEQSGDASKEEVDNMVTVVYKFYKDKETVHFSIATRYVDIVKDKDIGIKLYPIVHFNWQERKGSARGEGEVRYLIPNQIEVNRIEIRRAIAVKTQAFPTKVIDKSKISNPSALDRTGATIETNGQPVEDVHKIVSVLQPAQMSQDVKQLQDDLIQVTRDLAGAGDIATGNVNPEEASGRAILAVQQASQSPITQQKEDFKNAVEDMARIWLEYLIVYSVDGINMEEEVDTGDGEKQVQIVNVPQTVLEQLQATVKIDVTPKSPYDRHARIQALDNLLQGGYLTAQRVGELRIFATIVDDEDPIPKKEILEACDMIEAEQQKIAQMQAQTQQALMRAEQFLGSDLEAQASQMADAQMQAQAPQQPM